VIATRKSRYEGDSARTESVFAQSVNQITEQPIDRVTDSVDEVEVLRRKAELTRTKVRCPVSPAGKIERSADASRADHSPLLSLLKVESAPQIRVATSGTNGV
jgi:hypothetical protein